MGEGCSLTRKGWRRCGRIQNRRALGQPAGRVVGQVLLGTLARVRVLLEHIGFSLRCTAWRCTLAASCKRYAKGELSQGALGFPVTRAARARRGLDGGARGTAPRWPVGWGMCPNGAFHPFPGRRGGYERSARRPLLIVGQALTARLGAPGRVSGRCPRASCRS